MLLSDVIKKTGLTRKAVDYYIEQGLLAPRTLENGYREFSEADAACLQEIAVCRALGVGVADIRAVVRGEGRKALTALTAQRRIAARAQQEKDALLLRYAAGEPVGRIAEELAALSASQTIAVRLMDAFPGYIGQYFGLHFSAFLGERTASPDQERAYEEIVAWLDRLPPLDLPQDAADLLDEAAQMMTADRMEEMSRAVRSAAADPQAFIDAHGDFLRDYKAMKESEAWKASPAARLAACMRDFQRANGYEDVFLPAMKRLSPAYADYCRQLEAADALLRKHI